MRILTINLAMMLLFFCGCSQAVGVNEKAPDFTLESPDGASVTLSSYTGKTPVLLVFWATWCPYCVEEIPALIDLHSKKQGQLEIIAIDIQEDAAKIKSFAQKKNIPYMMLIDKTGKTASAYGVRGIPANILVGKDGKILYNGNSLNECLKKFE